MINIRGSEWESVMRWHGLKDLKKAPSFAGGMECFVHQLGIGLDPFFVSFTVRPERTVPTVLGPTTSFLGFTPVHPS